ncbi:MAG: hypothetical protein ACXVB9_08460 [Bdellovibrionota bacterium]
MKLPLMLVLLLSTFGPVAFAGSPPEGAVEEPLLQLTSNLNDTIYHLGLTLNSAGQVTGMYNKNVSTSAGDTNEAPETTFTLAAIESARGVVLFSSNHYNALLLSGHFDGVKQVGRFTVHYLVNGLTNRYLGCDFLLGKSDGEWTVLNVYNHAAVKAIHILTTMLGIRELEGLCPAS